MSAIAAPQNSQYDFEVHEVRGKWFAVFPHEVDLKANEVIDLEHITAIFLKPVVAERDLVIKARSVVAFAELQAQYGKVEILTCGKFVSFARIPERFEVDAEYQYANELPPQFTAPIIEDFAAADDKVKFVSGLVMTYMLTDPFNTGVYEPRMMEEAMDFFGMPLLKV